MNYYKELKNIIADGEIKVAVKEYSKNRITLETYYNAGKVLSEAGKAYGTNIIGEYSVRLEHDLGKKYSISTLKFMRQFYEFQKGQRVAGFLSISHYQVLLPLKDQNRIDYYIKLVISQNLTRDELRERIKNKEYERLSSDAKNKITNKQKLEIEDNIKNPIVIYNKSNVETIKLSEKILKELILENISSFLKELGNGYSFIDSEYKIKIGSEYNYIDLLLFNIEYNSYVVIELKVTKLRKEHIGQIEVYMNYVDKNIKKEHHNKTIGLILVKKGNEFILEYSSDERIKVREYLII